MQTTVCRLVCRLYKADLSENPEAPLQGGAWGPFHHSVAGGGWGIACLASNTPLADLIVHCDVSTLAYPWHWAQPNLRCSLFKTQFGGRPLHGLPVQVCSIYSRLNSRRLAASPV